MLSEAKVGLITVMPMAEGVTQHKNQQIKRKRHSMIPGGDDGKKNKKMTHGISENETPTCTWAFHFLKCLTCIWVFHFLKCPTSSVSALQAYIRIHTMILAEISRFIQIVSVCSITVSFQVHSFF